MTLNIPGPVLTAIQTHSETTYPHECCGFLLGRRTGDHLLLQEIVQATNQRTDSAHNRYTISPADYLKTEREAEARSLELLGFYHSHPDHPAEPSAYDLEHAWPNLVYLITSVFEGKAVETRAFVLAENRRTFHHVTYIEEDTHA